jgi:hypothetical protein
MITKTRMGFCSIELKLGNMRNAQNFTLCPGLNGNIATLQSDKRIAKVDIVTGRGIINGKNEQYGAYGAHLLFNSINIQLDENTCKNLQTHYLECPAGMNEVKSGDTVVMRF